MATPPPKKNPTHVQRIDGDNEKVHNTYNTFIFLMVYNRHAYRTNINLPIVIKKL